MKVTDINQFKGDLKTQLQIWAESKIDGIFPAKPQVRGILKKGLNNYMYRIDDKLDKIFGEFARISVFNGKNIHNPLSYKIFHLIIIYNYSK